MVKKGEQAFIPGTEPVKNTKVHNKAIAFARADEEYKLAKAKRDERHEVLKVAMVQESLERYQYGEIDAQMVHADHVRCKLVETGGTQ